MNQKIIQNVHSVFKRIRYKLQQTEFLRYAYLIFLAGFFLSPNNHLHRNFFYLFIIAPFLICLDSKFIQDCIRSTLFKLSILFLLYFLTSMFWSDADLSSEEYYDLTRYFLMLVIFILTTIMVSAGSAQFFDRIKFWLCLFALIAAISFALIFYASNSFPTVRLHGPFSYTRNPNQAAMYFGFVGIIAYSSASFSKITWQKIFYWFVSLTLFGYILLSQSRGPLLAFIIAIIVGSFFGKSWKTIGIFIILFTVFIISIEFFDVGIRSFYARGMADRIDIWMVTFKRLLQAPLLGEGYFTDVSIDIGRSLETSPHNLLLLVMLKSGAIGGGILLLLISTALVHSYRYVVASGNWIFLCIFAYFIVCMTFDSTHLLHKPTLGWLIFWLPVSLLAGEEVRRKSANTVRV